MSDDIRNWSMPEIEQRLPETTSQILFDEIYYMYTPPSPNKREEPEPKTAKNVPKYLFSLPEKHISTWTAEDVKNIRPSLFGTLKPEQIRELSVAAVRALSAEQFGWLQDSHLKAFTREQLAALTKVQLREISPERLSALLANPSLALKSPKPQPGTY